MLFLYLLKKYDVIGSHKKRLRTTTYFFCGEVKKRTSMFDVWLKKSTFSEATTPQIRPLLGSTKGGRNTVNPCYKDSICSQRCFH